jgi:hypothetical protein
MIDVDNGDDVWTELAADQLRLISGKSRVTVFRVR